jgi:hypothetical protein
MKVAIREQSVSRRCESLCQSVAKTVFHLVLRAGFCYLESIMAIMRARQNQIPRPAFARALVHRALLLHARITRNLHRIETNDIKMPNKIATLPCLAAGLPLLPADASRGRKMLCLSTNNES